MAGENMSLVMGRIAERSQKRDDHYWTKITAPAASEYESPSAFEVRSSKPLGQKGEDLRLPCRLSGYLEKPFTFVDKGTGEQITVRRTRMYLIAAEGE